MRRIPHRKKPPALGRLIILITSVFVIAMGGVKAVRWFGDDAAESAVQESVAVDIDTARARIDQNDAAGARELLAPLTAAPDSRTRVEAGYMLARLDHQEGKNADALSRVQGVLDQHPDSPLRPKLTVLKGNILESQGNASQAVALYREVADTAPPELKAAALTGLGRAAQREDDLVAARDFYQQAMRSAAWNSEDWNEALDALGTVNIETIFKLGSTAESRVYTVGSGDTLTGIGNKLNTTQGLLTRANGLSEEDTLQIGQQLKYTPKDFRIVIERSTCRLFLLDNGGVFKRYDAGLGAAGSETTLGSYKIGNKQKDPVWHKPGVGPIPALDPGNELGTRWMPLVPVDDNLPKDLGIHGTIHPETIGTYCSNGCARLHKTDVEELYDLVVRSTPVDIVEVFTPDDLG